MGEALFVIVLAELGQIRDPKGPLIGSLILLECPNPELAGHRFSAPGRHDRWPRNRYPIPESNAVA
jgi:hypothetical protein